MIEQGQLYTETNHHHIVIIYILFHCVGDFTERGSGPQCDRQKLDSNGNDQRRQQTILMTSTTESKVV